MRVMDASEQCWCRTHQCHMLDCQCLAPYPLRPDTWMVPHVAWNYETDCGPFESAKLGIGIEIGM